MGGSGEIEKKGIASHDLATAVKGDEGGAVVLNDEVSGTGEVEGGVGGAAVGERQDPGVAYRKHIRTIGLFNDEGACGLGRVSLDLKLDDIGVAVDQKLGSSGSGRAQSHSRS